MAVRKADLVLHFFQIIFSGFMTKEQEAKENF